ncbi:MAG TPA: YigZ family protein, partial [Eudoraea sp.]|nr:YigZ family protein [Eudoraea sp.]
MMEHAPETYRTLRKTSDSALFKDKKSKFISCAFPITSEQQVKPILEKLRQKYPSASHFCYAWQLGIIEPSYRVNDDGEPKNTAGMPIFGQIQSFELTNVLVVVLRIFGGTKLGAGGLINAYRTAARMALEGSSIIERTLQQEFTLSFPYSEMDRVMRMIRKMHLSVLQQEIGL